jgi:hypothetical protein
VRHGQFSQQIMKPNDSLVPVQVICSESGSGVPVLRDYFPEDCLSSFAEDNTTVKLMSGGT